MIKGWMAKVEIGYHDFQFKFDTVEDATDFIRVFINTYIEDPYDLERGHKTKYSVFPILEDPADETEDDIPVN